MTFSADTLMSVWERLNRLRPALDAMPQVEPVDPPADILAAFSAPPVPKYVPSPWSYTEVDSARENRVLDVLADLTVKGSPLEAARVLFGGPRV